MKKRLIALLLALSLSLPGCALAAQGLRIAASCVPAQLVALSAGAADVSLFIMPQMGYMEDYELSEPDFVRAQGADAVLLIGGGLESFDQMLYVEGLKPAIAAGDGIERLPGRVLDPDEDDTPADNPYVWLSPARWGELVHGAAAALAHLDPDNQAHYVAANEAAQEAVARVQLALSDAMRPYAGREVVVFHPALAYLCEDAGLSVVLQIERDPSLIPYAADIEEIDALLASYPDAVLVIEKDAPGAFANIGGRKTAVCEVLLRAVKTPGAMTWEGVMLENIQALARALE